MTEDLKHIVNGVTKLLSVNYNMISFDALSADRLIQILLEVLHKYNACLRFDVKEEEPEESLKRLLEALKKIQYQPKNENMNPIAFQRGLLDGEKRIIYPILKWIFDNEELVKESSYLAKYLLPLSLPPEALAIPEISRLMAQYQSTVDNFVATHREYKRSQTVGGQLNELRTDTESIEQEIENVKKRIEKTQAKLDKIPNQELFLEAAHGLRLEKDRHRELQSQFEEQKQGLQKAFMHQERLQRELNNAKMTTHSSSPEQLMDAIVEETSVLQYMVDVKLPQELQAEEKQLQIYQSIVAEANINASYLDNLQRSIDSINRDIQSLVEAKMANAQNDTLITFRQQANSVERNKDAAAEHLNQLTKELRDTEAVLRDRTMELQETIGEVVLRGEELKQYVNTLRAKSSVYKQKRAELAALKVEGNDLTLTLENLKAQDPNLNFSHVDEGGSGGGNSLEMSLEMSLEGHGLGEMSRLVEGLSRAVRQARERVTPLSQQMRPLRDRLQDLRGEHESKKQVSELLIGRVLWFPGDVRGNLLGLDLFPFRMR